jgi:sigma-B regulation protein RsbU (phosphoserine phosphatase)
MEKPILVIDDDPIIQKLLKRTLTQSGYEVVVASTGEEGITKALNSRPAMIICDWLMPGMSGLDVCKQVKTLPELSATFFILLTSLGSVDDRIKGLDAGSDDFLCKPIELNEFKARVRAGLRLYQLNQALQEQKKLLENELSEAANYVCSILPEPLINSILSIDFRFIPSFTLGGDCLDYYWLDEDNLVIYLLDVAGHGLKATLPSLSVINLLRYKGLNQVDYYQPKEVLKGLNRTFQMTQRNDKYFTIWYGVYNKQKRILTYASAGHPPAILLSDDPYEVVEKQYLKTVGMPIGMFHDSPYIEDQCQIVGPCSIYLFSDGIYEINQLNGNIWKLENFINLLKYQHRYSAKNLDDILDRVRKENIGNSFNDDLSIMRIDFH